MNKLDGVFREDYDELLDHGYYIKFVTMTHNSPPHWHRALEIQFILNGSATVNIEGSIYKLNPLDLIVIDSAKVHDGIYAMPQTMGVTIHISKNYMRKYIPDIELMSFVCTPDTITPEKKSAYYDLCHYMKELTIAYFNQNQSYQLKCNSLVSDMLSLLIDHFSISLSASMPKISFDKLSRMEQIYQYVEKNHSLPISLQDGADVLGLNKDYFCRLFKNHMGISFTNYINQIRINHIYQDLIHTDDSIQEILERHGFTNTKLFYRLFHERYHCTPIQLRKMAQNNPYT